MPKLNQQGVIHLLLPILLLAGIIGGVYLVTNGNPLKLFSKASVSGPVSTPLIAPWVKSADGFVGGKLEISWDSSRSGGASNKDWIGLFNQSTNQRLDWFWNNTCGYGDSGATAKATGACTINIPQGAATGNYVLKLYNGDSLITSSNLIISAGTQPTVSSATQVNPGENLTITWNSARSYEASTPKEWIGIYNKATNNRIDWFWNNTCGWGDSGLTAKPTGSCIRTIPTGVAIGDYELRLFNTDKQIASSNLKIGVLATPTPTPSPTLAPSSSAYKRVFLTSNTYNGNLGGVSGADNKCQLSASNGGLSGTWKAWISNGGALEAYQHNHSSTPYKLLNGTTIATNWTDLTDQTLLAPINVTEVGTTLAAANNGGNVWTNTASSGHPWDTQASLTCTGWTSSDLTQTGPAGSFMDTGWRWSTGENTYPKCDTSNRLYCFEQ